MSQDTAASLRSARSWLHDRPLILYAGAIGRANGVGYLVDFVRGLRTHVLDVASLFIGAGSEREVVEELARRAGLYETAVLFEPPMPKREIVVAFAAAEVAVCLFVNREPLWTE